MAKPVIFVFQYEVSLLLVWTASYSKQLSNDDSFLPAVVFIFRHASLQRCFIVIVTSLDA